MSVLAVALLSTLAALPATERSSAHNAALRYWMAFAMMENPPAEADLARKLASVADGQGEWSEAFAAVLDRNEDALATMHRGSRIETCDWGYELDLLAESPVANLPRARALARLNVLHGLRLMARKRSAEAVETWLAGVRFSRHIAADGPWLAALVAAPSLKAHLDVLARAMRRGEVDAAGRARIEATVSALPEAGFDWTLPARRESEGGSALLSRIENSADPVALLAKYFPAKSQDAGDNRAEVARRLGLEPAKLADTAAVRAVLQRARALNDELRPTLISAFEAPWVAAAPVFAQIDARASQDPLLSNVWSQASRHNEKRGEVVTARAGLLALLRGR